MSARQFNYFDDYKTEMLACPNCGWRGTFDQGSVETYEDLMDCACPKCDVFQAPILAEVLYPTLEELRANSDRPGIREWVQMIDRGFDEFEAQKLREPKQLPEIDEDSFTLVWDFVADKTYADDRTVLKHGDVVIFSEPARYEEYRRFGEVAEILKAKYGERIKDLVPTERSARYLYGDPRKGEAFVEWVRGHAFGASIVKPEPEDDYHKQRVIESIRALAPHDDLAVPEAEPTFQLSVTKPEEQQSGSVATAKARGPMRPVPGVPGVAWERTEYGTSLVMKPDPEFDNLPDEVRSDIIRRLMKCCAAPQHYLRVTAMRDEFATDPAKRQSDKRPSAETDFQYGPELPEIDAVEFSFVFDYSDDDSRYFVLYGKKVILSGPTANDPTDYITDEPLGGQFIEIAKKLKKQYGARLVDLVPTERASNSLMDIWGWALKRERGRKLVQERQGNAKKPATPATPPATPAAKPAAKPAASSERKPVDSAKASDGKTYKVGDVVSLKGKQVRITRLYSDGYFDYEPAKQFQSEEIIKGLGFGIEVANTDEEGTSVIVGRCVDPGVDVTNLTQSRTADTISKWPSHLVIVRHAESERNIWKEIATAKGELVYGGKVRDMDVPLTLDGERQALATGKRLVVEHKFDRVFVSPFKRTMETARLMIEQFPYAVEVIEDERLREIDFGVLDGLTKHGIAHFHTEEKERRAKLGKYHHRPPAGENYPDVALRLHSFLGTLTREAAGESVLVVCHSVVVLIFRKLLERLSEQQLLTIDGDKAQEVRNCSVTHYEFDANAGTNGKLILRDFNRVYYSLKMPEQSKPKPTNESDRKYPELSPEAQDRVLREFKKIQAVEKLMKDKPASPKIQ